MIREETNWAPKLALNRAWLRSSKRWAISSRRPNTVTRLWPVKASSTSELTTPVASHCWANSFWACLPTTVVTTSATGITVSAISDSCQEMRSEEHTSELQSRGHLVCRLLLERNYATRRAQSEPSRRQG